jgi:hypothetical protein
MYVNYGYSFRTNAMYSTKQFQVCEYNPIVHFSIPNDNMIVQTNNDDIYLNF